MRASFEESTSIVGTNEDEIEISFLALNQDHRGMERVYEIYNNFLNKIMINVEI